MGGSISLGRLFGIPLRIHWSAPVLVLFLGTGLARGTLPASVPGRSALVYATAGLLGAVLLTASLLLHEAAHALTARRSGIPVMDITVWGLGGVTRLGQAAAPRTQFLVAVAGPLTSLAVGGLGIAAGFATGHLLHWAVPAVVLLWAGGANVLLAVFNLLPAAPLDGGRILQSLIWWRGGDRTRAQRAAGRCGQAAGLLLMLLGWYQTVHGVGSGLWLMLVGGFLAVSATAEMRQAEVLAALAGVRVAEAMTVPPPTAPDWHSVADFLDTVPARTGQPVIALLDFEGRPSGVVEQNRLLLVPAARRASVRVRELAVPLEQCALAAPDDLLVDVLQRTAVAGRLLILALDEDGRLAGTVTPEDIMRVARRRVPRL
ncbi:site-2 protease family protein [Streptomyces orinoci]|uniref:Zinc metalloprotease n=1 Tax=Streptomyces orinoci TaxID=67339 RepID=A0ABV3K6N4_STRON|nr:site-2 protease family protein [Streptomyces orinoci]